MLRDALDHYNQQKDEVNQDDTLPAAAAKLTLTKRSDMANELLNASSVGIESIQSSTPIPMPKNSIQVQDHGEDHGDDQSSTPTSTLKSTSPAQEQGNDQQV